MSIRSIDVSTLRFVAGRFNDAAKHVSEAGTVTKSTKTEAVASNWIGDGREACVASLTTLETLLDNARQAMSDASRTISALAEDVSAKQSQADEIARQVPQIEREIITNPFSASDGLARLNDLIKRSRTLDDGARQQLAQTAGELRKVEDRAGAATGSELPPIAGVALRSDPPSNHFRTAAEGLRGAHDPSSEILPEPLGDALTLVRHWVSAGVVSHPWLKRPLERLDSWEARLPTHRLGRHIGEWAGKRWTVWETTLQRRTATQQAEAAAHVARAKQWFDKTSIRNIYQSLLRKRTRAVIAVRAGGIDRLLARVGKSDVVRRLVPAGLRKGIARGYAEWKVSAKLLTSAQGRDFRLLWNEGILTKRFTSAALPEALRIRLSLLGEGRRFASTSRVADGAADKALGRAGLRGLRVAAKFIPVVDVISDAAFALVFPDDISPDAHILNTMLIEADGRRYVLADLGQRRITNLDVIRFARDHQMEIVYSNGRAVLVAEAGRDPGATRLSVYDSASQIRAGRIGLEPGQRSDHFDGTGRRWYRAGDELSRSEVERIEALQSDGTLAKLEAKYGAVVRYRPKVETVFSLDSEDERRAVDEMIDLNPEYFDRAYPGLKLSDERKYELLMGGFRYRDLARGHSDDVVPKALVYGHRPIVTIEAPTEQARSDIEHELDRLVHQ